MRLTPLDIVRLVPAQCLAQNDIQGCQARRRPRRRKRCWPPHNHRPASVPRLATADLQSAVRQRPDYLRPLVSPLAGQGVAIDLASPLPRLAAAARVRSAGVLTSRVWHRWRPVATAITAASGLDRAIDAVTALLPDRLRAYLPAER